MSARRGPSSRTGTPRSAAGRLAGNPGTAGGTRRRQGRRGRCRGCRWAQSAPREVRACPGAHMLVDRPLARHRPDDRFRKICELRDREAVAFCGSFLGFVAILSLMTARILTGTEGGIDDGWRPGIGRTRPEDQRAAFGAYL